MTSEGQMANKEQSNVSLILIPMFCLCCYTVFSGTLMNLYKSVQSMCLPSDFSAPSLPPITMT